MIADGDMVRCAGGPPMKVIDRQDGLVRCAFIDSNARLHIRLFAHYQLAPLWLTLQPKTAWPDQNQFDPIELEKDRQHYEARKAERTRLAKKSKRIKRGAA